VLSGSSVDAAGERRRERERAGAGGDESIHCSKCTTVSFVFSIQGRTWNAGKAKMRVDDYTIKNVEPGEHFFAIKKIKK